MQRPHRPDDRALATGIIGFVAILIVVALLYTMMDAGFVQVITAVGADTSNAQAQAAIDERAAIWGAMPIFGVFLAAMFLFSRAAFESRGP